MKQLLKGDARIWRPKLDRPQYEVSVRFLPGHANDKGDIKSFETYYKKYPYGRHYIEIRNPENDPFDEIATNKPIKKFASNILVVDNPGSPEENGKVFVWIFDNKIMNRIIKDTDLYKSHTLKLQVRNKYPFIYTAADCWGSVTPLPENLESHNLTDILKPKTPAELSKIIEKLKNTNINIF